MPNLSAESSRATARGLNILLFAGIALRIAVLFTSSGINPDQHLEVIQYIAQHHALPISNQLGQSYHPPLYYLLMAPVYRFWAAPASVHFCSCIFSIANLLLMRKLIVNPLIFARAGARLICFALACFLPEYVMFGDFISNDTLTILLGTILFGAVVRYISKPNLTRLSIVALVTGLGLLTKGTFILSGFALIPIIVLVERNRRLAFAAMFTAIFLVVGSYKYVENFRHFGNPIVHNKDVVTEETQIERGTWTNWTRYTDINVVKLIRKPILQIHNTFSYPLLMYGTFWYPHIPDSSFRGNITGYAWVGSLIYALAVVPTVVFFVGLARIRSKVGLAALALILANFAVVIAAGIRFELWSCFQSRLCFQSMLPMLAIFGFGYDWLARNRKLAIVINTMCAVTIACCVLYFVIEFGLLAGVLKAGSQIQP